MITTEEAITRLRAAVDTARSAVVSRNTDYNGGYRDGLATALTVLQQCAGEQGTTAADESVDHPAHYGGDGNAYEAIRVIEAMGDGPAFCRGNAIKYLARYGKKGTPLDDLKKARWYVDRLISQIEGGEGV